jgi:hypothetical protein
MYGTDSVSKVCGVSAPPPRLTPLGAALLAVLIAVPGGGLIALVDWLVF